MNSPTTASRRGIRRRPAARSYSPGADETRVATLADRGSRKRGGRYTYVPAQHIADPDTIVALRRKLLDTIGGALDHQGHCHLSVTELAKRVGTARLPVSLQLAAMKYAGIIRRLTIAPGRCVTIIAEGATDDRPADRAMAGTSPSAPADPVA